MSSILDIINIPFGYVLRFCYNFTHSYAIALLIFAVLVKVVLLPLGIKQQKNQVKQASLRPREMAIRNKYAGRTDKITQQKMQEEVMDLYKQENFNPMGGCLPMLIEFPIIIILYNIIQAPLKYISMLGADVITAISERCAELGSSAVTQIQMINFMASDLSRFSDILPEGTVLPNFNIFGGLIDLSDTPSISNVSWLLAIPVLTFVAAFLSMKISRKFMYQAPTSGGSADNNTAMSMKIMDITMPLFSVWITFTVPAVIGVYWIYQNILSALRQFVLYKMYPYPKFTEEDYKAAERQANGKVSKNKAAKQKVRSLHRIDEEDSEPAEEEKPAEIKAPVAPAKLREDKVSAQKPYKPKPKSYITDDEPEKPADTAVTEKPSEEAGEKSASTGDNEKQDK